MAKYFMLTLITVQKIFKQDLSFWKLSRQWMSDLLSADQKLEYLNNSNILIVILRKREAILEKYCERNEFCFYVIINWVQYFQHLQYLQNPEQYYYERKATISGQINK
jgi:hypothetical protein